MLRARYFLKAKSNPMEYGPTSGRTWLITVLSVSVSSVRAAGFLFANDTLNRLSQESDGFTIGTKSISFTSQNTGDEFRRAAAKYDNLELSNGNSLAEMVRSDEGSIVRVEFSSGERPLLFVLSAYNERRDGLKVRRGLEPTVMLQVIEPARTPKSSTRSSLALEKGFGLTPAELRLVEDDVLGKNARRMRGLYWQRQEYLARPSPLNLCQNRYPQASRTHSSGQQFRHVAYRIK